MDAEPLALAADFAGATVHERFSIMMNERIGNVEGAIGELRAMLADVRDFMMTDVVYSIIDVPKWLHPELICNRLERVISM